MEKLRGSVETATGRVTEHGTGRVFSWTEWQAYKEQRRMAEAVRLNELRVDSSDLQNLWGRKPYFVDDWFNFFPAQRRPDIRSDFDYP